jgi:hypothetical protein
LMGLSNTIEYFVTNVDDLTLRCIKPALIVLHTLG